MKDTKQKKKKVDPDGPLPKWGEPEGVAQYMKKTPGQKNEACWDGYKKVGMKKKGKKMVPDCVPEMKTIKVGEDAIGSDNCHYALVKSRKVVATGTKEEMMNQCREEGGRVWVSTKVVGDIVEMKSFAEAKYSVDVDGLPRFYMDADNPAQIKKMLRQLLRKASSIDSVERVNDAKIKQDLRQRIKGSETDKRNVDEQQEYGCFPAGSLVYVKSDVLPEGVEGEDFWTNRPNDDVVYENDYGDDVYIEFKRIEDVVVGDVVLGYSGWNTVNEVHHYPQQSRNMVSYEFVGNLADWTGVLKCTDYHPIMFNRQRIWEMSKTFDHGDHTYAWCSVNPDLSNSQHVGLNVTRPLVGDYAVTYIAYPPDIAAPWNYTALQNMVESTEDIPVYNISVDGDNTYIVNSIVVHNKTVDEKLDPSKHDAGDYIKDFRSSDAPQFKGKSDKKKRQMAIAAYLNARREKGLEEMAYRKPTPAEIAADKKKDQKPRGDRYKSMKKKVYGNMMGGLKKEGRDPFKSAQRAAKHAELSHELRHEKDPYRPGTVGKAARKRSYDSFQHVRQMAKGMHKESTAEYGKSMDRIQAKKTASQLSPEHKKKLAALHNLMKKQRKTGNYKMEEVDQVNELKKSTYGSYIKKASKDAAAHKSSSVVYGKAADKEAPHSQGQKTMRKHELSSFQKSQRRQKGIERATDRLTKEELDEGRYYRGQRKGTEASLKMLKAASAIEAYAKKSGGADREDFEMAAMILNSGDFKSFEKFLRQMDTDPRDGILQILKKHGMYRGGKIVKEEKEEKDMSPEEKAKKRQAFLDRLRGKPPVKEEDEHHYVKVHGVRAGDHIIVKTKAPNKRAAVASVKKQWPKDKVTYHNEELDMNIDEGSIKGSDKSSLKGKLKKAFRKGEADQKKFNTPGDVPRRKEPKNPKTGEGKAYKAGRQAGYSTNKTGAARSKPQDSLNYKSNKMFPKRPTGFGPKPKLPESVEQQEGFADNKPQEKKKKFGSVDTSPAPGRKLSPGRMRMKGDSGYAPGRHSYAREEMETESFKHYTVTHAPTGKKYKVTAMHSNDAKKKAAAQHGGSTASRYSGTNHDDFHTEGMVRAVATARRMAGDMTGAAKKIDKMRPKKKGGDFSENPRVKKKLQKYNENVQSWKHFVESSCGGMGKKKMKEAELSPAQKKHMDTDKDGDIDGKDLATLRNKKKS